ncbi:Transcriptional repressor p66-beta isoform 3 [Schistosoma japonicum]|uniref:Transcriptional repressor p66-beta isoform 3 n=1 Tax=Schistosoma japonicum TaxID=6182 RepID=A0A4Z2DSZ6_SCHJA|nr:Transcriptional repressor p66-beta isoform 3 [Schistosoma japonicum]
MPQCCFAGCHNRTDDGRGLSFFRFPRRDAERTACWIKACGRKEFVPSQHSRVCSQHFKYDDFERDIRSELMVIGHKRLRLKETAVPCPSSVIMQSDIKYPKSYKPIPDSKRKFTTDSQVEYRSSQEDWRPLFSTLEKALLSESYSKMDPLVKRQCFDDVLDLSRKSNHVDNDDNKLSVRNDDDVIMLSEDEDDRLLGALCDEMEKENTPKQSLLSKSRALLLKLENELRNEESTLVLLQQLRANQRSHALQPRSTKGSSNTTSTVRSTQSPVNQVRPAGQIAGRTVPSTTGNRATQSPAQNSTAINSTNATSIPKVTKGMAVHALEQQFSGKKAMLRKQLERTLDKVVLPKPAVGNGLSVVPFVPSTLTNEFTAMIGLEEIVTTIQDFDPLNTERSSEQSRFVNPFSCSRCGTDFTPVWKRKRPGSSEVVCEACIIDSQRSAIHKAYNNVISTALKQHAVSEREIEHEYQDVVNSPAKLEAFIKEHERKLLATQQAQMVQQQQQQMQQVASVTGLHNQRYHQQQQGFQSQNVFNNTSSSRHGQTNVVNSASSSQLGIPNVPPRRQASSSNGSVNPPASLPIQQQGHSAGNVVQQLASRYQQLTKAAVAAVVGGGQSTVNHSVSGNAATANLMMAAAANPMLAAAAVSATNQQQQSVTQQQLTAAALAQQRLAAVAALNFQHQQPHHTQPSTGAVTPNSPIDHLAQFTQMQTLLMSSLLGNAGTYYYICAYYLNLNVLILFPVPYTFFGFRNSGKYL